MTDRISAIDPLPESKVPAWDLETDVIVVGFGAAGACAAIEASEQGADVTLLEVSSGSGGTSALSSSEIYMGGNGGTPAQRANGFEDTTEAMRDYLMMAGGPNADAAKVALYAEQSLAHYQWLTSQGMEFNTTFVAEKTIIHLTDDCLLFTGSEEAYPFNEAATPCPRGHKPKVEGDTGGPYLINILTEQVKKRAVDIHFDSRVRTLIRGAQRRIVGLVVREESKDRYVRARRGVVLCAGGFAMNQEMIKRYAPQFLRLGSDRAIGNPFDDGTGIRLGMGATGATTNMHEGFVSLPFYPPANFVKGILVNAQGQRFINEDCYHGRVGHFCLRQRDDTIYLVLDQDLYEKPNEYIGMTLAGTGETVAELEQELDLPEKSLQATLEVFNHHAAQGCDPLFGKNPKYIKALDQGSYAAFDCSIGKIYYPYFTLGGLDTLPTGEVLDSDQQIIPGLYAAGRNACGLPRTGAGYSSGMSIGDATFFGRQAGISAGNAVPHA